MEAPPERVLGRVGASRWAVRGPTRTIRWLELIVEGSTRVGRWGIRDGEFMVLPVARTFRAADAVLVRAFCLDVLAIPWLRAADGSRLLAYPPGRLGVHPRALSGAERDALGPDGLALTCDDLPEMTAELSAGGALLVRTGTTAQHVSTVTFWITLDQEVQLVAG